MRAAAWVLAALLTGTAAAAEPLAGTLTSAGSDTLSALFAHWSRDFARAHPGVRIQEQGLGSTSAVLALVEGAADLGPMSRPMSAEEEALFERRHGHRPSRIVIAHDAVAVFVHPDNPLHTLDLAQLDGIYAARPQCGGEPLRHWAEAGADGPLAARRILPIGRNAGSGTAAFFRDRVLCGGEYRADVVAWPGSGATVAAVGAQRAAIGYAPVGLVNAQVRTLALTPAHGAPVPIDAQSVRSGRYPLSRALYVYYNRIPQRPMPVLRSAFLAYTLSSEGQAIVAEEGFIPLDADAAAAQRLQLE
ncbi:MAG TPA: phosphate ABC transporter substrate-binding protein [Dokdonella sp.]|uniref:PstS family phosphate ABC transporter substrate-binding protein n=1 Tax=Dokdonella sp. TaxID=2291710 RepID=UPI002B72EBFA|nr:phosphate ABC transporter substrate-binding protein [Dokdonella sp.]HUD43104.1 phosphate ABC transporter substrate-binding protein [Dokdonella sp.]